jgi:hypothetical protein
MKPHQRETAPAPEKKQGTALDSDPLPITTSDASSALDQGSPPSSVMESAASSAPEPTKRLPPLEEQPKAFSGETETEQRDQTEAGPADPKSALSSAEEAGIQLHDGAAEEQSWWRTPVKDRGQRPASGRPERSTALEIGAAVVQWKWTLFWGIASVAGWLIVFGLGTLVDASPFRVALDGDFRQREKERIVAAEATRAGSEADMAKAVGLAQSGVKAIDDAYEVWSKKSAEAFAYGLFTYTPLNLAVLCFFAGLMGGCTSNVVYLRLREHERPRTETAKTESQETKEPAAESAETMRGTAQAERDKVHLFNLGEPPISAAVRSLIVYFAFIAGVFITNDAPFENITASGYIRYAGLISSVAFAVGYDPAMFGELLSRVPSIGRRR